MSTSTFNVKSVTKTNLYRTMRDKIMADTGLSESTVREMIGPMVEQAINQQKQRNAALEIATAMIQSYVTSPGTNGGGKVVLALPAPKEAPAKAGSKAQTATGGRLNAVKHRTKEEIADVTTLMEVFHRAFHEHNQEKHKLASKLGVSAGSIENWLSGQTHPATRNLKTIIKFLKRHSYQLPVRFV